MSEEDLELLITLDDPGEDALEEDTFNHFQAGNTVAYRSGQPLPQRADTIAEQGPILAPESPVYEPAGFSS
jgi:hypothetical protein